MADTVTQFRDQGQIVSFFLHHNLSYQIGLSNLPLATPCILLTSIPGDHSPKTGFLPR